MTTRREFLKTTSLAAAALSFPLNLDVTSDNPSTIWQVCSEITLDKSNIRVGLEQLQNVILTQIDSPQKFHKKHIHNMVFYGRGKISFITKRNKDNGIEGFAVFAIEGDDIYASLIRDILNEIERLKYLTDEELSSYEIKANISIEKSYRKELADFKSGNHSYHKFTQHINAEKPVIIECESIGETGDSQEDFLSHPWIQKTKSMMEDL